MVTALEIDTKRFVEKSVRYAPALKQGVEKGGEALSQLAVKLLRNSLISRGHVFSGNAWRSVSYERVSKNRWEIKVSKRAWLLDVSSPHFVRFGQKRLIREWFEEKANEEVAAIAKKR